MPSWIEFRLGCRGLYRLALFDRSFAEFFDRSTAGVLRSFGLFLPLLPMVLLQVWLGAVPPPPSLLLFLAAKSVASAYNWILFPFLILTAARILDRENEAPGAIAIYNWANVLWLVLQTPLTFAVVVGIPADIVQLVWIALLIASLVIEGSMFTVVLRPSPWHAAALVVLDFLLTALLIWPMGDWLGGVTVG